MPIVQSSIEMIFASEGGSRLVLDSTNNYSFMDPSRVLHGSLPWLGSMFCVVYEGHFFVVEQNLAMNIRNHHSRAVAICYDGHMVPKMPTLFNVIEALVILLLVNSASLIRLLCNGRKKLCFSSLWRLKTCL